MVRIVCVCVWRVYGFVGRGCSPLMKENMRFSSSPHVIPARCVSTSGGGPRGGPGRLLDLVFGKAVRLYSATLLLCPPGSSRYGFITGTCSYFVLDGGLRQIAKEECATAHAYIRL